MSYTERDIAWKQAYDAAVADRLREYGLRQGYQKADAIRDSRVLLVARGLQTALDADPQGLAGLDVQVWAERIVSSLPR